MLLQKTVNLLLFFLLLTACHILNEAVDLVEDVARVHILAFPSWSFASALGRAVVPLHVEHEVAPLTLRRAVTARPR